MQKITTSFQVVALLGLLSASCRGVSPEREGALTATAEAQIQQFCGQFFVSVLPGFDATPAPDEFTQDIPFATLEDLTSRIQVDSQRQELEDMLTHAKAMIAAGRQVFIETDTVNAQAEIVRKVDEGNQITCSRIFLSETESSMASQLGLTIHELIHAVSKDLAADIILDPEAARKEEQLADWYGSIIEHLAREDYPDSLQSEYLRVHGADLPSVVNDLLQKGYTDGSPLYSYIHDMQNRYGTSKILNLKNSTVGFNQQSIFYNLNRLEIHRNSLQETGIPILTQAEIDEIELIIDELEAKNLSLQSEIERLENEIEQIDSRWEVHTWSVSEQGEMEELVDQGFVTEDFFPARFDS